ncbi:MAG TPA: methylmalonyl-CoA mutase subunit beta, partial [Xanthobacteraceae bacterium]|nr:methylmalonyl-CoA mutase subunit beta [Xanthobacteraceae bacterium]
MTTEPAAEVFPLAADFPAATREDWLKLVAAALKGAPFEKLVTRTYDGLRIEPLYDRDPGAEAIPGRAPGAPWQVLVRVDHPDLAVANAEARHELANGATGLAVACAGAIGSYGYGIDASAAALARLFDGISFDAGVAVELDLGPCGLDAPRLLAELIATKGPPAASRVRFGLDPIGAMAVAGSSPRTWPELAASFAAGIVDLRRRGFVGPFAAADARPIHDAGGSQAQELAFALATATAYLRALEAGGLGLDDARALIFFRLAIDADQFPSIAKLRALRLLWARVEEACGLVPKPVFISAATAWRMLTRRDPWVNLLRATVATFSAGLGGADAVTVLPFTAALGLADRFARRLARNTQLILLEEANLAKVADPAAGAGAISDLTAQLCRAAWSLFQEIEAAGGAAAALEAGLVQREVAAVRGAREAAVATRRDPLTGTSAFPDLGELPVAVLDVAPMAAAPPGPAQVQFAALPRIRLAEPYEHLRDASDRILAATGARPKIFLANLGTLADFTARATFAKNFF